MSVDSASRVLSFMKPASILKPVRSAKVPQLAPEVARPEKAGRGRPRKADSEPVGIQAVDIAMDIIDRLMAHEDGMSLSEMSRATGLQPSKLHRYLVSLTRHGLLRQSTVTGQYDLGPFARRLGTAAFNRHHGLRVVQEAMADLSSQSGCTVYLYIWTELGPTLIRSELGRQSPPISLREGTALPAGGSATGRVFMAYLPTALTGDLLRHERKQPQGDNFRTWTDKELAAEFERIRAQRVYWTTDAILPGLLYLAPVFDSMNKLHSVMVLVPRRGSNSEADKQQVVALLEAQLDRMARELP